MSRESIFTKIRSALSVPGKTPPEYPAYDTAILHSPKRLAGDDNWQIFRNNFAAVNGRTMESVGELAVFLAGAGLKHGYCDPALMERVGSQLAATGLTVETVYERSRYDDYQFGITRATGAIAESGSVIIDDDLTSERLAALSPWAHVAVMMDGAPLHRTIPDAIAALGNSPNIIWATGPSKTADVEGILIEGVHGPGEQILLKI
jgi:L-lactate dehydrogenase complex protein LldG